MCFLDRPTNHVYRQVCHEWCAIIDTMTVTEECPFTFLEERRRREIATHVRNIMTSEVDTSHPMYLEEFAILTRHIVALKHMRTPIPVYTLTDDDKTRTHAKISTWLLLLHLWIYHSIRGRATSALDAPFDTEASFHKFWGITAFESFIYKHR